ncbi:MAG: WD40/YVTN/BNR-like repeat-containing protein [Anaerolineae bacterium]
MREDRWTRIGPVAPGGTVLGLTQDAEGRFWAATWGGLFRQEGKAWVPSPGSPPVSTPSGVWAAGPYLFVAGIAGGLARSADGGRTWAPCWLDEVEEPVLCLAASPHFAEDGVLLAGTDGGGVLRSEDRGRRWTRSNVGLQDLTVTALVCAPTWDHREVAFVGTLEGLYRSSGGGRAWRPTGWKKEAAIESLAMASWAEEPGFLLFVGTQDGLFCSADGGRTFETVGTALQEEGSLASVDTLWVNPDFARDNTVLATNAGDVLRSPDGGATWERVARLGSPILCLAGNGPQVAAGLQEGGLWFSHNGGRTWQQDPSLVARGLARLTTGGGQLFAFGAMEGAWRSANGQDWQALPGLEHEMLPIASLEAAQGSEGVLVLMGTAAGLLAWQDDERPEPIPELDPAQGGMVTAITFSPAFRDDSHVWAGREDGSLWHSDDGGRTWRELGHPFGESAVVGLASSPRYPDDGLLVAATHRPDHQETVIWRSLDRGKTWEVWTRQKAEWPRVTLFVAGEKGIESWASVGTFVLQPAFRDWRGYAVDDPSPPVMRVVRCPDGQIVAATTAGAYRSPNGRAWRPWNEGLPPGMGLVDLAFFAPTGKRPALWGLTPGGMIWRMAL